MCPSSLLPPWTDMQLKRYRRETVREALEAVKADLGLDALVLSTRMVAASGPRGWFGAREVEITAAADPAVVSEKRQEEPAPRPTARAHGDAVSEIAARLEAGGVDPLLARDLATAHPAKRRRGGGVQALHATLSAQLTPLVADAGAEPAMAAFIGPPGAGKTTTIAKIAAQERARHGRRLALVAADGFRVGAVEQLRLYADIIGSRFTVARTADELDLALGDTRGPLLIDTAGRSPSDDAARDTFRVLAGRTDVRTHLVLPAGTSPSDARRVFDRFEEARPTRVVLTRLDEVQSIGPLLRVLRDRQIPLSYFGTGQDVPEHLQRVTPALLAARVLGEDTREGAVA
jgi:flagellar biosynthesis protein FlhF